MKALEHRVPPPLVGLLFGCLMVAIAYATPRMELGSLRWIMAAAIFALALGFVLPALLSFSRHKTTVNPLRPERASALVISGAFRFTRNPMYLGMAFALVALAIGLESPWSLIGVVGFMSFLTVFQIIPEERAMQKRFGEAYEAYKKQVRRWL